MEHVLFSNTLNREAVLASYKGSRSPLLATLLVLEQPVLEGDCSFSMWSPGSVLNPLNPKPQTVVFRGLGFRAYRVEGLQVVLGVRVAFHNIPKTLEPLKVMKLESASIPGEWALQL